MLRAKFQSPGGCRLKRHGERGDTGQSSATVHVGRPVYLVKPGKPMREIQPLTQ